MAKEEGYVLLSDDELVRRTYELIALGAGDQGLDERRLDELYWVLGELFERHVPDAEWAEVTRSLADNDDPPSELAAVRDSHLRRVEARHRARLVVAGA